MTRTAVKKTGTTHVKHSFSDRVVQTVIIVVITLLCLLIVIPCLNVVALAFNNGKDAARGGITIFPRDFTLDNFREVFKDAHILSAYGITIARTVIGTFCALTVTSLTAFALRHKNMPGNKLITIFITFTMLFGGGMIPTYIQYHDLGLLNSFWVYVVPSLISVIYLMMMRTAFEVIPESLYESARLDGCGFFRIYTQIALPLTTPTLAVIGLYTAVNHWNDWFSGAFYMNDPNKWPMQTVLQQMLSQAMASREVTTVSQAIAANANTVTSDSLKMAAVVITTVPILCVYPFVQKYFTQGIMLGAEKG